MSEARPPYDLAPEELRLGEEAYLRYLGGVSMLHDTSTEFALDLCAADIADAYIATAEQLMYSGARRLIRTANLRLISEAAEMEKNYATVLPRMWHIVDNTYIDLGARLAHLGEAITVLRPAAFTDEKIYHHLTHPRKDKLQTQRLMDSVSPSPLVAESLQRRTLKTMARLDND